jgi:hypothetical protein
MPRQAWQCDAGFYRHPVSALLWAQDFYLHFHFAPWKKNEKKIQIFNKNKIINRKTTHLAHREASALTNELPEVSGQFRFLRVACYTNIKRVSGVDFGESFRHEDFHTS